MAKCSCGFVVSELVVGSGEPEIKEENTLLTYLKHQNLRGIHAILWTHSPSGQGRNFETTVILQSFCLVNSHFIKFFFLVNRHFIVFSW